tara:strand:- start:492 stop:803 length:312 start_codon:yes stop_codon:yes gene_type:complete
MSNKKFQAKKILNNKTVHFVLPGEIHRKMRAKLFLKESSIQNFFKVLSEKFIEDDPYIISILEKSVADIKENKIKKLKEVNEKDLYDAIESESPFKKNRKQNK